MPPGEGPGDPLKCAVCGSTLEHRITPFSELGRVTSDCRIWPSGGGLAQCQACGAVQKPGDAAWLADCDAIYSTYDNYALSGGVEQSVRGGPNGADYAPRSELVLAALSRAFDLPDVGRILDYGCGRGPTSRAASRLLPEWTIDGFDLDRRAAKELSTIPGFDTLHTGDPAEISTRYDLIVLMHALEHIPEPHKVLGVLETLLAPGGRIVIQVPNRLANPFDLVVADHVLHFDRVALHKVAIRARLTPLALAEDWVVKELSLVVGTGPAIAPPAPVAQAAEDQVEWLTRVAETAVEAAKRRPFGIFGTSIVGTWLNNSITIAGGQQPDFYLDEDPAKQGQTLDGVQILSPEQAPKGSAIVMAMAPRVARAVGQRLAPLGLDFVAFPEHTL